MNETERREETSSGAAPRPDSSSRRSWLELGASFLISLVLVLVWVVPKGFQGGTRILGHPDSDVVKHYWNLWWFRRMVLHEGELPYFTAYLNFPFGMKLYPIEPLNNLAALVLVGPLGLAWTTNLLAVLNLAFAGVGMFALVRELTGRFWPSICAGSFYALSSYAVWTVYVGVGELSHLGWMPLALLFLIRTARAGGRKNMALATLLFFLTAFACWYYALFLFMLAGLLALADPWRGRQTHRLWGRYLAVIGLSLACLLPIVRAFDTSYRAEERSSEPLLTYIRNRIQARPHDGPETRLDIRTLLTGGKTAKQAAIKSPYVGGRYVGLSILVLAASGLLLRLRQAFPWLLGLGASVTLGLGSRLVVAGRETGGLLPFAWLNLVLERLTGQPMNFPARFTMPVTLALAVLAGLGLAGLLSHLERPLERLKGRAGRNVAAGLVVVIGFVPLLESRARGDIRLPLPSREIPPQPMAEAVARADESFAVIEIPQAFQEVGRMNRDEILLMQTVHGKKSASVPIDRISMFVFRGRQELKGNPLVRTMLIFAGEPMGEMLPCCVDVEPNDPITVYHRKDLLQKGFRRVIVTTREMTPAAAAQVRHYCAHVFGRALLEDERQALYEIRERVEP